NFKQKARARPGDKDDPALGSGFGCFVPSERYMEEVGKHADQDEILGDMERKHEEIERPTRDGGGICSMLTTWTISTKWDGRPAERGKWSIKFYERMAQVPPDLRMPSNVDITFKVPKFHLPAHIEKCYAPYALEFTEGVGDTDGEAPERNWSELNCSARSLSMMTAGGRFDTTDDICNDWNHEKTIDLSNALMKKLVKGISNLVVYSHWERQVIEWEQKLRKDCPYEMPASSITMAKVKKALADEEQRREKRGENRRERDTFTETGEEEGPMGEDHGGVAS
ncbi:hypothetical protein MPER_06857, partial [Moniliophthora perniciosa FA553]